MNIKVKYPQKDLGIKKDEEKPSLTDFIGDFLGSSSDYHCETPKPKKKTNAELSREIQELTEQVNQLLNKVDDLENLFYSLKSDHEDHEHDAHGKLKKHYYPGFGVYDNRTMR